MTTNGIKEKLEEVGLTNNQITVYLELVQTKKCRASVIIEKTKLHRSIVYLALDDLISKGLVSKLTQGGVAAFEPTDPKNLVEMIETKKRAASSVADDLARMMREAPRDIRVFEGEEAIIQARKRSLELPAGETVYILGGSLKSSTPTMEARWIDFHDKRSKKGLRAKILGDRTLPQEIVAHRNSLPLTQSKYLPFKEDMPAWFEAYGDMFGVGIPASDPILFSLRSPEAASALKNFFEYLWNQNVRVESGTEALRKAMLEILDELKPGETYCVLGAAFGLMGKEAVRLYAEYHKARVKKGVRIRMLAYTESIEQINRLFTDAGDDSGKLSSIKPLTTSPKNPTQIYIYGNKVCMAIMGETPTVIHFDQPGLHESFQAHFDYLWGQESRVVEGPEALQRIWLEAVEAKELKFIGARGYFIDRYPKLFEAIRKKAESTPGVLWKNVVDPGVKGHRLTKFSWSKTKYTLSATRNPNVVWIYSNKVAIANWSGDTPIIFVSENRQLFQSYNDYFEELWNAKTE